MSQRRLPTAQRREQLADAALSILSAEGARAVTVKAIAQKVGITDGAVFRHFPDTQALFRAAVARFDAQLPELPSEALPAGERLGQFFIERARVVQARPEIMGLAVSDRLQELVGGAAAKRVQARVEESVRFIGRCLAELQASGALDDDIDPKIVTWMITGAMRGAARGGLDPEAAWADVQRALFKRRRRRKPKEKS